MTSQVSDGVSHCVFSTHPSDDFNGSGRKRTTKTTCNVPCVNCCLPGFNDETMETEMEKLSTWHA